MLYVSRIVDHKRQHLAVESLRYTRTPVKLVIAGEANSQLYLEEILRVVEQYNLADRVTVLGRWISEDEKLELYANCLAALYLPFDEDSYGYSSLEAQHASKAVITTRDAGGPLELVVNGENGYVTDASPRALADAMDRFYSDRASARRMGEAGRARIPQLGITWENVLHKLLS